MLEPISPPLSGTGSPCVDAGEVATLQLLDVSALSHPFPLGKVWLHVSLHYGMAS